MERTRQADRNLVTEALSLIGNERLIKYNKNKFPVQKVLDFFMRKPGWEKYLANIVGIEFEKDLNLYLVKIGAENIQNEVEIETPLGKTSIDALFYFKNELHLAEAKCTTEAPQKCITQIKKYRGYYKDAKTHLYLAKDTKVSTNIEKQLIKNKTDIIRSEQTKKDVIDKLLSMQKSILN